MTAPRLIRRNPAAKVGIVHLGPGAFFRAFNAVYTDDAMAAAGGEWGILAVSLRSPTARDQMGPQGGAYTAITLGPEGRKARVIGSVTNVLVAPEDPAAVIASMADPSVKIVSLTITEKGYCNDPATGHLDLTHPDITHDLAQPDSPRSAIGFITAALRLRKDTGRSPFTVLSCDNLPGNGALMAASTLTFARQVDPELAAWIETNVTFPATMVDRITPATTPDDVSWLAENLGYHDPACVVHESFRQWVIEDDFVAGRPDWHLAEAQMVRSVAAHEHMKLRCLNGTHSALAYLGYLAGYETIADCVADPDFAALCQRLWQNEITPTLTPPDGEDLQAYCATLLARYRDLSIRHRTWQIAMDGSQKLPQRILGTVRDKLAAGHVPHGLCLVVAAWMRYVGGVDEKGAPIDVRDPLAVRLKTLSDTTEIKVDALLSVTDIFGTDLPQHEAFRNAVSQAYDTLVKKGSKGAVAAYVHD